MATVNKRDEQQIMAAVKAATDYVTSGMTPNSAIEKVARDFKFGPGQIQLIGHAYNTGQQLSQWRSGSANILDKMASFPLCDPHAVIASMSANPEKTATCSVSSDYLRPPQTLEAIAREKTASAPLPFPKAELVRYERETGYDAVKAYGNVARIKQAADEARREASAQQDVVRTRVAELATYFKKASYNRIPFATAEAVAAEYYGPVASRLLAAVYESGNLKEKRAAATPQIVARPIDHNAAPFTLIKEAIAAATACSAARTVEQETRQKYAVAKDAIKSFPAAGSARPQTESGPDPLAVFGGSVKSAFGFGTEVAAIAAGDILAHKATHPTADDDPYGDVADIDAGVEQVKRQVAKTMRRRPVKVAGEKTALFGPAFGAAIGGGIGRGLNSAAPKSTGDMVDDSWMSLEDPEHENDLRKIRAHATINQLMTDPDDPISGHDPDKVLNAYNEISQATPRLAENIAMLRPALRKRLEGHQEPFEAKELLDIEHGLTRTKLPTPNTNIMGETPSKILG